MSNGAKGEIRTHALSGHTVLQTGVLNHLTTFAYNSLMTYARKHVNPTVLLNRTVANRKLASLGRFERPTQGLEILCSIQLNYRDRFINKTHYSS